MFDNNHGIKNVTEAAEKSITTPKLLILSIARDILIAVIIAVLIITLFPIAFVNGNSMYPTLHDGDIVFSRHIGYTPERGDIIIARWGDKYLIKRVIGLPDDTISINANNGVLSINGEPYAEIYVYSPMSNAHGDMIGKTITVEEDHVFVMGDNRVHSQDSRYNDPGQIPFDNIQGGLFASFRFGDVHPEA